MKICFLIKYEITWGSSRERVGVYLEALKKRGHAYRIISVIPNRLSGIGLGNKSDTSFLFRWFYSFWYSKILKYLKFIFLIKISPAFDVIVIQKVNIPVILLRLLKARNKNVIFDFDDLCFLAESAKDIGFWQRLKLKWRHWYQDPKVLAEFRHVIAGNKYLAKIANDAQQTNVTIIPTPVDCMAYSPCQRGKNYPLVIGFTGAGENHLRHLKLLINPLARIGKTHKFIFRLIGAMHSDKIKSLFSSANYEFDCIDWLGVRELPQAIRSFDIGVMPLVDDDQARSKCGFKALLYMASGVATVASPVGVNSEIVRDGVNGLLSASEDEWFEKLTLLLDNESTRNSLALKGRETVENNYCIDKASALFIDTLESAARG